MSAKTHAVYNAGEVGIVQAALRREKNSQARIKTRRFHLKESYASNKPFQAQLSQDLSYESAELPSHQFLEHKPLRLR